MTVGYYIVSCSINDCVILALVVMVIISVAALVVCITIVCIGCLCRLFDGQYDFTVFNPKSLLKRNIVYRQCEMIIPSMLSCFHALSMSRLMYALPAWGGFVSIEQTNRINALLKRCYQYGYVDKIHCLSDLLNSVDQSRP